VSPLSPELIVSTLPPRAICLSLLALLALGACDRPEAAGPVIARDSAGVRILEISVPAGQAPLEAIPVAAPAADTVAWYQVTELAWLAEDAFVALNRGTMELVWVELDGAVRRIGGEGEGPGEFRMPIGVSVGPDGRVHVIDRRNRTWSVFDRQGALVSTEALDNLPPISYVRQAGIRGDERAIVAEAGFAFPRGAQGIYDDSLTFFVVHRSGEPLDTAFNVFWLQHDRQPDRTSAVWPAASTDYAVGPDAIFAAPGNSSDIQRRAVDGTLEGLIRFPEAVAVWPPTAPEGQLFVQRLLVADDEGRLWTHRFADPADAAEERWVVVDPIGERLVGVVMLPEGFTLRAVRGNRLIGVLRDELDVEHVRVLGVRGLGDPAGAGGGV